jgi:hypothetical protein
MNETSHQIERHIQQTRNDLEDNLNELGDKVKKAVDWRAQVEERPGTMLSLAFAGGMIVSALFSSGRRTRSTYAAGASLRERQAWTPSVPSYSRPGNPSETRRNVEALAGALIGVAVNRASRFIDSLVPGFEREFRSARVSKSAASRSGSGGPTQSDIPLNHPQQELTDSYSS